MEPSKDSQIYHLNMAFFTSVSQFVIENDSLCFLPLRGYFEFMGIHDLDLTKGVFKPWLVSAMAAG